MSFLNKLFKNKVGPVSVVLSVIISVLFVVAVVEAATTISANINTGGTLTVTGVSTFGDNITVPAAYGLDTAGAGALNIGTTTATSINYGGSSVTAHTFTSDGTGTAEVVLPAGSIDSTELLDGTVAKADMATAFMTIGIVEDGTSGWDPNSATVLFLVTADASAIALDSLVLISLSVNNDNIQCFVTKLVTSVNFMVVCNAAPLNGARLHYMIIN
jgi:hypothetical protein